MKTTTRKTRIATAFAAFALGATGLLATAPVATAISAAQVSSPVHVVTSDIDWPK